ncbi:MAG: hypothetical protein BWY25_03024 [Chloroflexi bacterium ADurb.Bin222]|nr:MAG: hypothetical protein BWY25_03024 [Chloroflexi bacterium ADurb.Bin222]
MPIADIQAFVELLGDAHGLDRSIVEFARGFLLQGAGGIGRRGTAPPLPLLDPQYLVLSALESLQQGQHVRLRAQLRFITVDADQARAERFAVALFTGTPGSQLRIESPILLRHESFNLAFTFDHQAERHGLYAPGRESAANLAPQQGAEVVADQTVQHAARLLRVHQVEAEGTGMRKGFRHGGLSNLMEDDAMGALGRQLQDLAQVPGDGFAFAVGVGGEVDIAGFGGGRLELFDHGAFFVRDAVFGREVVLHIHGELGAQQVAHVPDGGFDVVALPQKAPDSARLRRRFDDDELAGGFGGFDDGGSQRLV